MIREDELKPGDVLAYYSKTPIGLIIRVKTWHKITHVETYIGDGKTIAARIRGGVDIYPLDLEGVVGVYRPIPPFDLRAAMDWFNAKAKGQSYDWLGIFGFVFQNAGALTKQFCSELCTRFSRAGGVEPFQPKEDADKVAPFQFSTTPVFREIYQNWRN